MLISADALHRRIMELGTSIRRDLGDEPITLICFVNASLAFGHDLMSAIGGEVRTTFLWSTDLTSKWFLENKALLQERCLLVQDIVDSGETLQSLLGRLQDNGSREVRSVCLLNKKCNRTTNIEPDYTGFSIPDEYVVGYGMGLRGKFDNLPHIAYYAP